MQPRFVGRLGVADAVTAANAALGFLAAVAAAVEPGLAAQLILLAAVADGLDGVVARKLGSTPAGEYLDSLADVASFGVAPAVLVFVLAREEWSLTEPSLLTVAAFCVPALFVAMAVVRLGLYTAYDVGNAHTEGVQTTLAGTILAASVLAGVTDPAVLVAATGIFAYLMVTSVDYPDLYARDALAMGGVQALALLVPTAFGRAFPRLLLVAALAYLLLGPRFYWREIPAAEENPAEETTAKKTTADAGAGGADARDADAGEADAGEADAGNADASDADAGGPDARDAETSHGD